MIVGSAVRERASVVPSWRALRPALAILALGFALYASLWHEAPITTFDTPSYMRLARDIRALQLTELSQRTPGYPLFLLLTGSADHLTRALYYASLAAQFAAAGLIAWALVRNGVARSYVVAFAAVAVLPPFVAPAAYGETEALCQLALAATFASLALWVRSKSGFAFAVFAASSVFAAFVRPTYEFLLPVFGICALIAARGGALSATMRGVAVRFGVTAALALAAFASYAALNYRAFGYFEMSSMGALALSHKVASFVEFLPAEPARFREIMIRHRDQLMAEPFGDHTGEDYIYRAMPELNRLYNGNRTAMLKDVKSASISLILRKPFSYVRASLGAFAAYMMPVDYAVLGSGNVARGLSAAVQWAALALFLVQALAMAGAALLAVGARISGAAAPVLDGALRASLAVYTAGMTIVAYTAVVSCFAGIGQARYRVPTDYLILGLTALGFTLAGRMCRAWFGKTERA